MRRLAFLTACLIIPAQAALAAHDLGLGSGLTTLGASAPLFQVPFANPGAIPSDLECMDGSPAVPVLRCGVPADEDRWACWDRDGAEVPVTQGVGTVYEDGPWGRAMVGAATIPDALEIWAGTADHTIVGIGRPSDASSTNNERHLIADNTVSEAGFIAYYRADSNNNDFRCSYFTDAGRVDAALVGQRARLGSWQVHVCRRAGDTFTARINGSTATAVSNGSVLSSTHPMRIGQSTTGTMPFGREALVLEYDCALTDDSLARFEAQVYGTRASDGRPVTTARPGPAWCDGGYQVGNNAPCVDADGYESRRAVLELIPNNTAPGDSGWVAVGDGVTVNADKTLTITDNTTGSYEGVRWTISGLAGGDPGALECEVRSNAGSRVRIAVGDNLTTDGQQFPLGPEWQTVSIARSAVTGIPHPGVYVGPWATDTGTIDVRRCQFVKAPYIGRRCDSGESPTTCPGDVASIPVADIPPGAEVCATIEPFACTGDGQVILDTRGADGEGIVLYLDDECHLALDATWQIPMTVSDQTPVPIGEPTEVCWRLSPGFQVRRDGVPAVTLSTAILGHGDTLYIGVDRDGGHQLEGRIKDVEVRR